MSYQPLSQFVSECYSSTARKRQGPPLGVSLWPASPLQLLQHFLHVSSTCIKLQATSCQIIVGPNGTGAGFSLRFLCFPLVIIIPPLPPDSPEQAARYHILGPALGGLLCSNQIYLLHFCETEHRCWIEQSHDPDLVFMSQTSCKEHKKPWRYAPCISSRGQFRTFSFVFTCQRSSRHLWDIIT
jgi:hypothetical protein